MTCPKLEFMKGFLRCLLMQASLFRSKWITSCDMSQLEEQLQLGFCGIILCLNIGGSVSGQSERIVKVEILSFTQVPRQTRVIGQVSALHSIPDCDDSSRILSV